MDHGPTFFQKLMEVGKKMKVWVEKHPKMWNLRGCHYFLKVMFEKIFLKNRSGLVRVPQRVKEKIM